MRVSRLATFLCGAVALVKGDILTIRVPEVIKNGDTINVTVYNDIGQSSGAQMSLAFGFAPSPALPNGELGFYLGAIDLRTIPLGVFNLTLNTQGTFPPQGEGALNIALFGTNGVTNNLYVELWNASVSLGTATSKTYVQAQTIGGI
ncbi:hypothetical protein V8C35DRAFT_273066 [Trichoderma chlorosporum]